MTASLTTNAAAPTGCENARQGASLLRAPERTGRACPLSLDQSGYALSRGIDLIEPFSRIDRDAAGRVVRVAPLVPVPFAGGGIRWNDGLRTGERAR